MSHESAAARTHPDSPLFRAMAVRGWSAKDLARRAGLTQATVARLVNDAAACPKYATAVRLSDALDAPIARLWPGLDPAPPLVQMMAARGVGVGELARHAGVYPDTVGDWLGGRRHPGAEQAARAAAALGVHPDDVFPCVALRSDPAVPPADPPLRRLLTVEEVFAAEATGHPDWECAAACASGHDPDRWWPQHPGEAGVYARTVCATCVVVGDCRDAFLGADLNQRERLEADRGIWAGLPGRTLRALARRPERDQSLCAERHEGQRRDGMAR